MPGDYVENWVAGGKHIVTGAIKNKLEPHNSTRTDNPCKAKCFAEYARQNLGVGRLQLIRLLDGRIKRPDMSPAPSVTIFPALYPTTILPYF